MKPRKLGDTLEHPFRARALNFKDACQNRHGPPVVCAVGYVRCDKTNATSWGLL